MMKHDLKNDQKMIKKMKNEKNDKNMIKK